MVEILDDNHGYALYRAVSALKMGSLPSSRPSKAPLMKAMSGSGLAPHRRPIRAAERSSREDANFSFVAGSTRREARQSFTIRKLDLPGPGRDR